MNKHTHTILTCLLLGCSCLAIAQESNFYGFVRTDFVAQSRKTKTSVNDLFAFFAMPIQPDANGNDLNNSPSAGMYSITTRLGYNLRGNGIFGAGHSLSKIEADFSGGPDFVWVRLRQAYTQLVWNHSHLIVGQTWHPLFSLSVMPTLININTGAPYQPFNRSPQIRYTYLWDHFSLMGAAVYQTMYKSTGPIGSSLQYQKEALIPNLYVGGEFQQNGWLTGLGFDYKAIKPETNSKKLLHTFSGIAYASYQTGRFRTTAKCLVGQNLVEHSIIGGYAITDQHDYIATNSLASFATVSYGEQNRFHLFAGYSANLGSQRTLPSHFDYYGFGIVDNQMIQDMYRVSFCYTYQPNNWRIGFELEYNNVAWSEISLRTDVDRRRSDVVRLDAILQYNF